MKYIFSILLFLIIFESVVTDKFRTKRMALAMKTMKNIYEAKLKRRKLEDTDESMSDTETGTIEPNNTQSDDPSVEPKNMTVNETVATETVQNNTNASVQIKKFHNFPKRPPTQKTFTFGVFFYFLGKKIARTVVIRLKIVYIYRGLRNLQEGDTAESVPANCTIKEKYEEFAGKDGNGTNVDYDCEGVTQFSGEITNATLDTNYSLKLDDEILPFTEVNFDSDAASEAENIVSAPNYSLTGSLSHSKVEFKGSNFFINGDSTFDPEITDDTIGKELPMEFIHYTSKENYIKKNITCNILNKTAINCKGSVRSYLLNITQAKCYDPEVYLSINIDPEDETGEFVGSSQTKTYRKNSSGLSGGSIAGIVIACVVVILAASIAAIMLRKPTPPIDNTTVVDLNPVENV